MKLFNLVAILSLTVTVLCSSQTSSESGSEPKKQDSMVKFLSAHFEKASEPLSMTQSEINSSAIPFVNTGNTLKSTSKNITKDRGVLNGDQLSSLSSEELSQYLLRKGTPPPPPSSPLLPCKKTFSTIDQESKNSSTNHIKQYVSDKDSTMNYFELIGSFRIITKEYSKAAELIFDYNSNAYLYNFYPCTNLAVFRLHSNIDVVELDKVLLLMNDELNVMEIKNTKEKVVKLKDIGLISNFYKLTSLSLNHVVVDDQSGLFCNFPFMKTLTKVSFTDSPIGNDFVNWLKINTDKLPWKELYLNNTQLTQEAAEILLNCDLLDQLELLELSGNGIDYSNLKVPTYKRPSLRVIVTNNGKCMKTLTKIQSTEK